MTPLCRYLYHMNFNECCGQSKIAQDVCQNSMDCVHSSRYWHRGTSAPTIAVFSHVLVCLPAHIRLHKIPRQKIQVASMVTYISQYNCAKSEALWRDMSYDIICFCLIPLEGLQCMQKIVLDIWFHV